MDLSTLVRNSFKYPFRNIKKLPILFLFFILIAIIPIGLISNNDYVVAVGVIAFFLFILFVPGYFLSIVKLGSSQSAMLPSFNLVNNIYDSIRVLFLRIASAPIRQELSLNRTSLLSMLNKAVGKDVLTDIRFM